MNKPLVPNHEFLIEESVPQRGFAGTKGHALTVRNLYTGVVQKDVKITPTQMKLLRAFLGVSVSDSCKQRVFKVPRKNASLPVPKITFEDALTYLPIWREGAEYYVGNLPMLQT